MIIFGGARRMECTAGGTDCKSSHVVCTIWMLPAAALACEALAGGAGNGREWKIYFSCKVLQEKTSAKYTLYCSLKDFQRPLGYGWRELVVWVLRAFFIAQPSWGEDFIYLQTKLMGEEVKKKKKIAWPARQSRGAKVHPGVKSKVCIFPCPRIGHRLSVPPGLECVPEALKSCFLFVCCTSAMVPLELAVRLVAPK